MMNLAIALGSLRPGKEFTYDNDDLATVRWNDPDVVTPTQKEIDAEIKRLDKESATRKASAESKLETLGLTVDDLKALLS